MSRTRSKDFRTTRNHAVRPVPHRAGSEDIPASPNTLVDSEIDPYPDDAVPIGLLASLATSSLRDNTGATSDKTPKTGEGNTAAEGDDVVCLFFLCGVTTREQV